MQRVFEMLHRHFLYISAVGFCNSERTDEGVKGIFQWNETEVNSTTSTGCFYGPPDVIVTRFCVSRNNLSAPSLENCRTIASTRFAALKNVRQWNCTNRQKIARLITIHKVYCSFKQNHNSNFCSILLKTSVDKHHRGQHWHSDKQPHCCHYDN